MPNSYQVTVDEHPACKKKKKNETFIDVSDIVKGYSQKQDKEVLEKELKSKIVELKKIK